MSIVSANEGQEHRRRPLRLRIHSALRWLHIYLSLFSLLVILFFSVTGITLNHPEWTFGQKETKRDVRGTLPGGWQTPHGTDWLRIADYLRETNGVRGHVTDRRDDGGDGSISFRAPGYAADCDFQPQSGAYTLTITGEGPFEALNDLHRGHDAGPIWAKVVDLAGVFLSVIALTGLGLLLYLKKIRTSGLTILAVGCVIMILLLRTAF